MLRLISRVLTAKDQRAAGVTMLKEENRRIVVLRRFTESRRMIERHQSAQCLGPIFNSVQFLLICDLDVPLLTWEMMCSETLWRRKLVARLLAMTLAEYLEDLPQVLGKEFMPTLKAVCRGERLFSELKASMNKLKDFKGRHERTLREIRNSTAAHREQDSDLFLAALDAINPDELWKLSVEFSNILGEFLGLMIKVHAQINRLLKEKPE
jgi:hypothetical protein